MGKINSGPASSLLFEYDTNLIGDTNSDTEYADPENKEFIWPKDTFRINSARWLDTELGFNHPERPVQVEAFNGTEVQFHVIFYKTKEEIDDDYKGSSLHRAFIDSAFYDVAVIDRETGRYLNALDKTNEAFTAFRNSFNVEEQRQYNEWKENKDSESIDTNFTETDRKSVWEVLSGATTEDLFKFKLDIFEQEVVQNSENRELRSKIRKSKSICEVCAAYQELLDEEAGSEE